MNNKEYKMSGWVRESHFLFKFHCMHWGHHAGWDATKKEMMLAHIAGLIQKLDNNEKSPATSCRLQQDAIYVSRN